ncbi:conserved protein of unknown function [Magnetospirillum sp. XM-1]|uniref:primase-helicase family protein n=1 Tax=Magnetospirillum sp. XM-1 TaxID=1663591 RepID=UPI00073E0256|nr:primase-helicase family protein [Magnetospirillum sp. XM-1]CUW37713.1 conserved protein of unknown function [Magnetospirillum sp. XM-1]
MNTSIDAKIQDLTIQAEQLKVARKTAAQADKQAAAALREQQRLDLERRIKEIIQRQDYRYIRGQGCYVERSPAGWGFLNKQALQNSHAELQSSEGFMLFTKILEADGRIYRDITATFDQAPEQHLNLIDRRDWVQPNVDDVHPFFNYLTWTLSGENEEAQDHIEHVIARKYLRPEDFTIPCMVFYPQGGIGKNVFVDNVLCTIFGRHQVASVSTDNVSGSFNGVIAGKTIVFIDESQNDKLDMEKMKRLVGNRYVVINEKFQRPYQVENTALYLIGGNDIRGVIRVGHDNSDRRWSVIKASRPMPEVIADLRGITIDEAKLWISENIWVTRDAREVGRWLHNILVRHKDKGAPSAYHGEDFNELASNQRPAWEMVAHEVFGDEAFTYVSAPKLHEMVSIFTKQFFPNSRVPNVNDLRACVSSWLGKHPEFGVGPEIRKVNLTNLGGDRTISSTSAWVRGNGSSCERVNIVEKWVSCGSWRAEEDAINHDPEPVEDMLKRFKNRGLSVVN